METLPRTVQIARGSWRGRELARLPLEAALLLAGCTLLFCLAFHSLWALLVVVPLWSFCKWHTRKDARFLQAWRGQLSYKRYYHG